MSSPFAWECPDCGVLLHSEARKAAHFCQWKRDHESSPAFFRTLSAWRRHDMPDGTEVIELQFAEGGRVNVTTDKPLMFIEPERH